MILQKLTTRNIMKISEKKVCCIGYSVSYLNELCAAYDILKNIEYIIDENTRNYGSHTLCGKQVEVLNAEYLSRIDFAKTTLLITSDYYKEEYEKLQNIDVIKSGVDTVYYFANKETEYEDEYRERYRDASLENIIIFRSGPHASSYVKGMDFADNARALFEYMIENGYNEKYELVWLVKNPPEFEQYRDVYNVKFLSFDWSVSIDKDERDSYYNALCLAKYLFFTDAYGFARNCRKDQIRVQLWHGCGFKTRVNFVRCEKRYEYTTVISDLYSQIHQDIYGLRSDQMLVTGYAKQDWLFQPVDGWLEKLKIPKVKKYIFWLPTFRSAKEQLQNLDEYKLEGQIGLPVVSTYDMLEQMDEVLKTFDAVLLIKLHPFQDRKKIGEVAYRNIVMLDNEQLVQKDIQINRLLGHADALISDYSSVAVDYMLLDRPIAFTLDDVEEYEQSRGFVFEKIKDWLPGMEIYTFEDFVRFVREACTGIDTTRQKRQMLLGKMHKYKEVGSCKRIIDALKM